MTDTPSTSTSDTSRRGAAAEEKRSGCCGGAPKADPTACCARDEQAKARGEAGCGCGGDAAGKAGC